MSVLDGPGEGTWSVFAAKVVEERDALREKVSSLEAERVPDEQRRIVPEWRKCVGGEPAVDRARRATQLLVAEIGAEGPMDVVDAAEAAVTEIRRQSARATRSMSKLAAVAKLLVANGCDCDCDCEHHYEDHDDDCERCFACKVSAAIGELA